MRSFIRPGRALILVCGLAAGLAPACVMAQTVPSALFAAERAAVGGNAWNRVASLRTHGRMIAGDAPGTYSRIIDLTSGYSRTTSVTGAFRDDNGFDGEIWDKQNGIVTLADLPSLQQDAVTQSYIARNGWWQDKGATMTLEPQKGGGVSDVVAVVPDGGSRVEVWLDRRTHLITQLIANTDAGPQTTHFEDWRDYGGLRLPTKTVVTDADGSSTTWTVDSADAASAPAGAGLARPLPDPRAVLTDDRPVPFQFTAFDKGHIVVDGSIDHRPARLLFDTGAANYLTPDSARRFGLGISGGVNIGGVGNNSTTGGFAPMTEIAIGPATLKNQIAVVGPLPYPAIHPRADLDVDGLVGFEFLSEFQVTVDYPQRTLRFQDLGAPPPVGSVSVRFYSDGHSIYIPATVEGADGLFRLDTGDRGTLTLFATFARAHDLFRSQGVRAIETGGVGGHVPLRRVIAGKVVLGGVAFNAVPTGISETTSGTFASRSIAGNIGAGLLQRFVVTFNYRTHTVSFRPSAAAHDAFPEDHLGLSVTQTDSAGIQVLSVVPGSPTAAAGLQPGDLITAIDGRSVARQHLGVFDLEPYRDLRHSLVLEIHRGGDVKTLVVRQRAAENHF